jgi:hypothetical protein
VKGKSKSGEKTYTVDRKYGPSHSPVQDITMLSGKGSAFLRSTVSVTKLPNGNLSYDESVVCLTPLTEAMGSTGPGRAELKNLLPARFRSNSAAVDAATQAILKPFVGYMFGPPYPHMFEMMGDEDAAQMYMRSSITSAITASLAQALPNTTPGERTAIMKGIWDAFKKAVNPAKQFDPTASASGGAPGMASMGALSAMTSMSSKGDDNMNQMTPLLFVVSFPGTVVQTNGIIDPASGKVFWSMYPLGAIAAIKEPIHLHLVVRP